MKVFSVAVISGIRERTALLKLSKTRVTQNARIARAVVSSKQNQLAWIRLTIVASFLNNAIQSNTGALTVLIIRFAFKFDEIFPRILNRFSLRKVVGEADKALIFDHKVYDFIDEGLFVGKEHVLEEFSLEAEEEIALLRSAV